jgi:hypothetical protein
VGRHGPMSGTGSGSDLAAYETAETLLGRLRELSTDLRALLRDLEAELGR